MPDAQNAIWTRNFTALFALRFVSTLTYFVLNTTLVAIVYELFLVNAAEAGMVVSAFMCGQVLGRLLLTRYTDIIGRRRTMLIAAVLSVATIGLYFIQVHYGAFLVVRFLHGAVQGVYSNVIGTVGFAIFAGSKRFGEGVATYSLSVSLATAVGPFLGLSLLQTFSYTGVFVGAVVIMTVVFIGTLFTDIREAPLTPEQKAALLRHHGVDNFVERSAVPVSLLVGFTSNMSYIIITAFLNSFAQELGLAQFASLYFVVYAVCLLVFRPFAGRAMDRYGNRRAMLPAFVFNVIGLVVLGLSSNLLMLMLSAVLNALGQGCLFANGQAAATRNVSAERLNVATSTYYVFADVGYMVGPVLFGFVVPALGYSGMYLIAAVMMAASAVLYFVYETLRTKK